ncbi:ABC-type multidrug transport system ATPase subunit [Dysgonomonas hofstadii]|uniref:ABC-type multidrug transport system ATPase subunit n=1 Tax=Dysgonomonas hofstadii TaxID=637886 RepID=A0A840CRK6_9BACT|nr:ATP-binding cassette domain-containing protein [Dysgonomonas hofstadii]MBB4035565.1 ABC-type multidrug transport system ATPase subunit [Dysgonomonas hofstadii]
MLTDNEIHIIEADSISKAYPIQQVLSGVYLKMQTGDICALFGRNGTGKTTLQRIIFGSLRADYKFIRIDERYEKNAYTKPELISYLPATHFISPGMKTRQVLNLYGIPPDGDNIILKLYNKRISSMSSGERRYLEVYLILKKKAHFALLDEPFKFLSPLMIEQTEELIQMEAKEKGIIVADHRYRNVLNVANRILLMKDQSLYELKDEEELRDKGYII